MPQQIRPNTRSMHCRDGVVTSARAVVCVCVGGMLYSACVRPPATMSPINDNTKQSSSIEILTCEFGTSTQAQAPHFMIAETHTHTPAAKSPPWRSHPFFNSAESAVAEVTISRCCRGDSQGEKD